MKTARIYRPAGTPTQSAHSQAGKWILEFLPDSQARRHRDPLMGWTGYNDTQNSQVRLYFSTRDEAIAYAKRANLSYQLHEPNDRRVIIKSYAANFIPSSVSRALRP